MITAGRCREKGLDSLDVDACASGRLVFQGNRGSYFLSSRTSSASLRKLVRPDHGTGTLRDRLGGGGVQNGGGNRRLEETAGPGAGFEQGFHLGPQRRVFGAGLVQVL